MADDDAPHRVIARAAYAAVASPGAGITPGCDVERAVDAAADAVRAALLSAAPATGVPAEPGASAHVPLAVLPCARAGVPTGTVAAVADDGEVVLRAVTTGGFELWSAAGEGSSVGHRLTAADAAALAVALLPAVPDGAPLPVEVRDAARAAAVERHVLSTHLAGISVDPSRISERTRRIVQRQTEECVDAAAEVVWRFALAARRPS